MTIQTRRHTVIPAGIMDVRVRAPASAAIPWWLSGGVTAANCLAAYTPKGAASLAASYDNNAAPGNGLADGTYDAAPGVAPTFAAATGWTFNGSTQHLLTGITPGATYSMIVRFSSGPAAADKKVAGFYNLIGTVTRFFVTPNYTGSVCRYGHGGAATGGAGLTVGVLAIVPGAGYRNGVADAVIASGGTTWEDIHIGAAGYLATAADYWNGNVLALAIYNAALTLAQVAAITTAMNAL